MEVSGHTVFGADGTGTGFEGTARAMDDLSSTRRAADEIRERVPALVSGHNIVTAFSPSGALPTGR
jgi:hypothetical protein